MEISLEVKARKINICQGTKCQEKFYILSVDSSVKAVGQYQSAFLYFYEEKCNILYYNLAL